MGYFKVVGLVALVGLLLSGCSRIQTKIVEKPRVDQEIQGNRGYLKGSAPVGIPRRATREMVETNVELPTWAEMNPWRKLGKEAPAEVTSAPPPIPAYEPPPSRRWEPETPVAVSGPVAGVAYTVQKGDTLQKISQKFYGTTKNWYKIYKANKDVLKSPDKIRPGQTITIPDAEGSSPEELSNEYK